MLTTDGDAAHRLTHPSRQIPRTYVATVQGDVSQAVHAIRRGVALDDGIVHAHVDSTTPLGGARTAIQLTIAEGRTREIRRLCDAVETVFLMTGAEFSYLSSSIVKEIARLGGSVEGLVPNSVGQSLQQKLHKP